MIASLIVTASSATTGEEAFEAMEHYEAVEMMASERYLLDELTPELRDAYEDHMFGCTECVNDLRFGSAFVDQAKIVLPQMTLQVESPKQPLKSALEKRDWFAWLRPAIMVPAFGCLLAIVGYQNLVVYPALQASATEPRLLPPATVLRGETRGSLPIVNADLVNGSTLSVPLPQNSSQGNHYTCFRFGFYNSKGNIVWTKSIQSMENSDDLATIWLPAHFKQDSYKLTVTGVTSGGENIVVSQQFFDLRAKK